MSSLTTSLSLNPRRPLLSLALAVSVTACGCVWTHGVGEGSAEAAPDTAAPQPDAKPRVQSKWQAQMTDELAAATPAFDEAWGLFSEGGWADNGQFLAFAGKNGRSRLQLVEPASKVVAADRSLTDAEKASLTDAAKAAAGLPDLDIASYDGIVYEYVHAVKDADGHVQVTQRTLIRNPNKPHPDYDALIAAFMKLRPPPAKPPVKPAKP